jgi:hypothetical protein
MKDGERQLLGAVVICGMLIGALLATWPRGTPAAIPPDSSICAAADQPAVVIDQSWGPWQKNWSCQEQHLP